MLKVFIIILVSLAGIPYGNAQTPSASGSHSQPVFHSFNTIQLLNGSSATSIAINSVNGFQFSRLFAGVGIGFDYYFHTTIPLFAEARYELLSRKNKLQLFANGGVSFPFSGQDDKTWNRTGHYNTGSLYGAGIDYLLPVKSKAMILGIAFSNKQVIQMLDNNIWNLMLDRVENEPIREKYALNRIALRVGLRF